MRFAFSKQTQILSLPLLGSGTCYLLRLNDAFGHFLLIDEWIEA